MRNYVLKVAKTFHGIRLDNCHSTPIAAAEYVIDAARTVRPDLYVIAELFTSNEDTDNIFVNRLGITSLIREAQAAWDSHEQGRLVHRYGGEPVGSFLQPQARPLTRTIAHAVLCHLTHDNPSPVETRSVYDLLATGALVSMASCAIGSNRGYDELVPHHIDVVEETRFYSKYADKVPADSPPGEFVSMDTGIMRGKAALNSLHEELGKNDFTQTYVDQVDRDIVALTRHCPINHHAVILVARTCFKHPANPRETGFIKPLCIPGKIEEIIFEMRMEHLHPPGEVHPPAHEVHKRNTEFLNGVGDHYTCIVHRHVQNYYSQMVEFKTLKSDFTLQEVEFINFPPGSVIAFRVALSPNVKSSILQMRRCLTEFGFRPRTDSGQFAHAPGSDFRSIVQRLTLADFNHVLYRCHEEEVDDGKGGGAYEVPGLGRLLFCGLQGVVTELNRIRKTNDLGHPVCRNLRDGDWLIHYVVRRLRKNPRTNELGCWFKDVFTYLIRLPRYLVPCYYDAVVSGAYAICLDTAWALMPEFMSSGSAFVQQLALGSIQCCGIVKTSPLPTLSPHLAPPLPEMAEDAATGMKKQITVTMAAGLPHFSIGAFRSWGRDTFISLRGLLLLTGRHQEARLIILAYGQCLRHGLIPNLLDGGANARYNARDAVWWWLISIKEYVTLAPNGHNILRDQVSRLFPIDEVHAKPAGFCDQPLQDTIQEALQRHMDGVHYRERNAGPGLDGDMCDQGFNNKIGVNHENGFVYGGSVHNCGTWMDKNGSSHEAGNFGKPATPRDGSAVELVAMCQAVVGWLAQMKRQGKFEYGGVRVISTTGKRADMSYEEWSRRIINNFEPEFWIPLKGNAPGEKRPDLYNKRGIYKDTLGASHEWGDYQLRPNFPVAMVLAPALFDPEHAWQALQACEKHLLGPLGMKTLDPDDWTYRGDYVNSDHSNNFQTAHGYNYHNGPEWLWPVGYFLRAKLLYANILENQKGQVGLIKQTSKFIKEVVAKHYKYMQRSKWCGLPELTNSDGKECPDSCGLQAWSMATLIEAMYDLDLMGASTFD